MTHPQAGTPATKVNRRSELIAAAQHLLETEGVDAITIRRLGAAVGIRGPSVYKHIPEKATIEHELVAICFTAQTEALQGVPCTFAALADATRRADCDVLVVHTTG